MKPIEIIGTIALFFMFSILLSIHIGNHSIQNQFYQTVELLSETTYVSSAENLIVNHPELKLIPEKLQKIQKLKREISDATADPIPPTEEEALELKHKRKLVQQMTEDIQKLIE